MFKWKIFLVITVIVCLIITMSIIANANLLAECNNCNATGHCDLCNGEKTVICGNCNGTGILNCDQCQETGKVTCHICNGIGINPANAEENCPQCNGTGKEICNSCKGNITVPCNSCTNGTHPCNRCEGSGICSSCKGTGYKDGQNNGVTNIPKKGDTVQLLSGKSIKWGVTEENNNTEDNSNNLPATSVEQEKDNPNENNNSVPPEESNKLKEQDKDKSKEHDNNGVNIPIAAFVSINAEKIGEKYMEKYNAYTQEQLNSITNDVKAIVATAKIDIVSADVQNVVDKVLKENKIDKNKDTKICTINFEGHMNIDFPVSVTVYIDSNMYNSDEVVYAYHILNDNTIESLGEVEKVLEDNKVFAVTFKTTGFSDFFLSTEKLNTEADTTNNPVDGNATTGIEDEGNIVTDSENNNTMIYLIAGISLLGIILVILTIIIHRK